MPLRIVKTVYNNESEDLFEWTTYFDDGAKVFSSEGESILVTPDGQKKDIVYAQTEHGDLISADEAGGDRETNASPMTVQEITEWLQAMGHGAAMPRRDGWHMLKNGKVVVEPFDNVGEGEVPDRTTPEINVQGTPELGESINRFEILLECSLHNFSKTPKGALLHAIHLVFGLNESEIDNLRSLIAEADTDPHNQPTSDDEYIGWLTKIVSILGERVGKGSPVPSTDDLQSLLMQIIQKTVPGQVMKKYFSTKDLPQFAEQLRTYWKHIIARDPNWPAKLARNLAAIKHIQVVQARPSIA